MTTAVALVASTEARADEARREVGTSLFGWKIENFELKTGILGVLDVVVVSNSDR